MAKRNYIAAFHKNLKKEAPAAPSTQYSNPYKVAHNKFQDGLRVIVWATTDGKASVHLMRAPSSDATTKNLLKATTNEQWHELCERLAEVLETRADNKYLRLSFGDKAMFKIDSLPDNEGTGFHTIVSVCRYCTGEFYNKNAVSSTTNYGDKKPWHHEQQTIVLTDDHIKWLLEDADLNNL